MGKVNRGFIQKREKTIKRKGKGDFKKGQRSDKVNDLSSDMQLFI